MKISIIGSRTFFDFELVEKTILENLKIDDINCVISGGAKGADTIGEDFAKKYNIETKIFKPDWKKHGKIAGFIRNTTIIENSDIVFAFWDGKSNGTKDSINKTKNLNKKLILKYF